MKKTGVSVVFLFILTLLIINGLIITTAYKAIFNYFKHVNAPPYLELTTDAITVLLACLVVFTAIVIILERRDPARTLAWLLVLIFLPVLGFVLYMTVGRQIRKRRLTAKKRRLSEFIYPLEESIPESNPDFSKLPASKERLMNLIINTAESPITLYNDVQVLTDGDQIFSAMFEALESAREHIHLETYILRSDEIGSRLMEILLAKARQGVEVRVIYDALGSRELGESYLQSLRQAGIKIEPFFPVRFPILHNRINYRNHRKILVVDGRIGFVGGANIGDEYLGRDPGIGYWRDTHLRISGNAVCFLQRIFLLDWYFITKESLEEKFPCPTGERPGNKIVQIASSGPDTHWESIMQAYYYAIATAEKSVHLSSAYFIPNESILTALKTAALSGVDVKILLPDRTDHQIVFLAAMSYLEELMEAGVEVYLYQKGLMHCKVLTVDGVLSVIGSANMDQRSFRLNFEVNALVYDKETARRLDEDFARDLLDSHALDLESFKERSLPRRVLESAARLLSPLL
ncbi:MAG: cardiolipin synthase [Peptococcaceae bacterium]|jgi:cardiolipin synthase|nr:cardiolipin synthase [Peptococcaceae bacterium]MDH7524820.1 cardiolipin synthase [Peptococcaceae bacterium]